MWTVRAGASCGFEFAEGGRYTVFSRLSEGKYQVDSCGGTTEGPINNSVFLLPGGYPPGADPLITLRSAIVAGVLLAGAVLIVLDRRKRPASISAA